MNQQSIQTVIFANSIKHGQHCVAGKTLDGKRWVRPVSDSDGKELTHSQAKCRNPHGTFNVKPLQKVTIGLSAHVPLINQPENYLIDGSVWKQNYTLDDHHIINYLDHPSDLWGKDDRVRYELIKSGQLVVSQSLYLVQVGNLRLYVSPFNKRRASFIYNGCGYDLPVTDPSFDVLVQDKGDIKGILCISLGEEFEGNYYKLIATIF
ncbi:hypothetical protein Q4575_04695 [Psychrosphaera sp. 1_MG-2023]|uniref:dual OB domain-containing protein n=1 Tax=Psychrosphaera sp. 1_MG-2023 TaxID=3062643 RepID=UPI0026E194A6|nr:hypothetical protein [Psychrosphaera sp. 1_MG-2023]MDO6718685.1 hypothetical protein [Psychrosphaera sp. 1_MG-2023]